MELERRHGQGNVQLRLRFKRGLHPFYPPSVELLRPRFCGPLLGALASHPLLQVPLSSSALPPPSRGALLHGRGACSLCCGCVRGIYSVRVYSSVGRRLRIS